AGRPGDPQVQGGRVRRAGEADRSAPPQERGAGEGRARNLENESGRLAHQACAGPAVRLGPERPDPSGERCRVRAAGLSSGRAAAGVDGAIPLSRGDRAADRGAARGRAAWRQPQRESPPTQFERRSHSDHAQRIGVARRRWTGDRCDRHPPRHARLSEDGPGPGTLEDRAAGEDQRTREIRGSRRRPRAEDDPARARAHPHPRPARGALRGGGAVMPEADVVSQEELQRRYDRLHVVYQLTSALSQSLALGEIYNEALHALEAGINARRASILLFDDDGVMRFKAWRGLSDGYRAAVEGHSPWQRDDRSPQPILVPDVTAEPSLSDLQSAIVAEGIRAVGFIPLVAEERLLGKFMVYYAEPHDFTNEERRLIQNIAQHI